jgi:hypothetical protein
VVWKTSLTAIRVGDGVGEQGEEALGGFVALVGDGDGPEKPGAAAMVPDGAGMARSLGIGRISGAVSVENAGQEAASSRGEQREERVADHEK